MRLSHGRWLNDECVNAYIALINKQQRGPDQEPRPSRTTEQIVQDTFVFNSFFFTQLQNMRKNKDYSFTKLQRVVTEKKVNLRRCKNIVVPINIKSSHWLLLNLNTSTNTFYIIDSMLSSSESQQVLIKRYENEYVDLVRQFMQDYFDSTKAERRQSHAKSLPGGAPVHALEDNMSLW